jgi:hypothetical protein
MNRLTDGDEIVSLTRRQRFTPQEIHVQEEAASILLLRPTLFVIQIAIYYRNAHYE